MSCSHEQHPLAIYSVKSLAAITHSNHITDMCRVIGYKSRACSHRWLTITSRCAPNMGFTMTPVHEFRSDGCSILGRPSFTKAPAGTCPDCDLRGQYDGNTIRLVLGSGDREVQRNMHMLNMQHGGLVGYAGGRNTMCRSPDVTGLGVYQQQMAMDGYRQPGLQYYPVAQRCTYGYGQPPGSTPASCNVM